MDIKKKSEQRAKEMDHGGGSAEAGGGSGQGTDLPLAFVLQCLDQNVSGDAEIFKKLWWKDFVFNSSAGVWLYWQGHHWEIDFKNFALAAVAGVADVYLEASKELSKKIRELDDADQNEKALKRQRSQLIKRAYALRDVPRGQRVLIMTASGPDGFCLKGDELDQKPWIAACLNGEIDLITGCLQKGRQKNYISKHSPVEFKGIETPCPTWEKTILEIFSGNIVLVEFFQRICGCALVGEVVHSFIVVLTGRGRNGKSLVIETLSNVMGQLAGPVRSEVLLDSFSINSSGPTPGIMVFQGKRLVFASEIDEGRKWAISMMKWVSGKDSFIGRHPHDKYEVTFKPSHTLFVLTNHKPRASADDFAFWERIILIPFELSFVDRDPVKENERRADPELSSKLEKEFPGILAWMVRGCLEWQKIGLAPPAIVKEAVDEYKRDEDILGNFIQECCVIQEGCSVKSSDVYSAFKEWWKGNVSNKPPSAQKFGRWFGNRFERKKIPDAIYLGVGLLGENYDFDHFDKTSK